MLVTQWYILKNWVGADKSWKKAVFLFPVGWPRLEETDEKNRFRHHLQTRLFLKSLFSFSFKDRNRTVSRIGGDRDRAKDGVDAMIVCRLLNLNLSISAIELC